MGLIDFLKQKGFIEDGPGNKDKGKTNQPDATQVSGVAPTYFPITDIGSGGSSASVQSEPSFVTPLVILWISNDRKMVQQTLQNR